MVTQLGDLIHTLNASNVQNEIISSSSVRLTRDKSYTILSVARRRMYTKLYVYQDNLILAVL